MTHSSQDKAKEELEINYDKLSEQVLNIKLMEPIFRLHINRNKGVNNDVKEDIDLVAATMVLFDIVLREMDFSKGLTYKQLNGAANKVITMISSSLTEEELKAVASYLVDGLTNRKQNYQKFTVEFWHPLENDLADKNFRYLEPVIESDAGEVYFTLTQEGSLVYFSGLEVESRIGPLIDQLRVELMIQRGETRRALLFARQLLTRASVQNKELEDIRFRIQRNSRTVHFDADLHPILLDSKALFDQMAKSDKGLKFAAEAMLDKASDEDFLTVSELIKVLVAVSQRHVALSNKASELCDEYLARVSRAIPMANNICQIEPEEDVLVPLLSINHTQIAGDTGDIFASAFMPWINKDSNKIFNPFDFMELTDEWLREQVERELETPATEEQIIERNSLRDRFSSVVIDTCVGFIEGALLRQGDSVTLYALYEQLKQEFRDDPELDNLVKCMLMLCVDWYAHQDGQTTAFRLTPGAQLDLEGCYFVNNYTITRIRGGL
ncbi:hypothetical protein NTE10_000603 [Vibrio harveyi]|nr:hypothetical protein [Vibrio harveyi]